MKKVLTILFLIVLLLSPKNIFAYEIDKLVEKIDNVDNITMIFDNKDGTYDIYFESSTNGGKFDGFIGNYEPLKPERGILNIKLNKETEFLGMKVIEKIGPYKDKFGKIYQASKNPIYDKTLNEITWDISLIEQPEVIEINSSFKIPAFPLNAIKIKVKPKKNHLNLNYSPVNQAYFKGDKPQVSSGEEKVETYYFYIPSVYEKKDPIKFNIEIVEKEKSKNITSFNRSDNKEYEVLVTYNNKNNLELNNAKIFYLGMVKNFTIKEGQQEIRFPIDKTKLEDELKSNNFLNVKLEGDYINITGDNRSPYHQLNNNKFVTYKNRESFGNEMVLSPLEGNQSSIIPNEIKELIYPVGNEPGKVFEFDADYNYISTNKEENEKFVDLVKIPIEVKGEKKSPDKVNGWEYIIIPKKEEDETLPKGQGKAQLESPKIFTKNHIAYIHGYPNETVKPNGNITREEVSAVFYRLLEKEYKKSIWSMENNFNDVEKNRWSNKHISTLFKGKIIEGYPDSSFRPSNNITRAELAAIASRFDVLSTIDKNMFEDIDNHWANKYIKSAALKGWVTGYPDGEFKPDKYLIRAEFVTIVNNILVRHTHEADMVSGRIEFKDLSNEKWYYDAMQEAINSHHYNRKSDSKFEIWKDLYYPEIDF